MTVLSKLATYPYPLRIAVAQKVRSWARGFSRDHYYINVRRAAEEAMRLGYRRLTVIEFGVADGKGLIELETICTYVKKRTGVEFDIFGFDIGKGLPKPTDYRDTPYKWAEGWYRMDFERLRKSLKHAQLVIGDVSETVPAFIRSTLTNPLGAVMFDLDYYSSTMAALAVLDNAPAEVRLPRIFCYFDDINGIEDAGVLLAINEFNAVHAMVKISPRYHYRYDPFPYYIGWKQFECHQFDHPRYGQLVRSERPL